MSNLPKPIAVLISDVHYNKNSLKLADTAMRLAAAKAHGLRVPLIVAGDLHDTKGHIDAACANSLIDFMKDTKAQVKLYR